MSEPRQRLSSGYQGSVFLAGEGAGRRVVKVAMGIGPLRRARQAMLEREYRVYQRLSRVGGVPRCLGMTPEGGLELEYIDGVPLRGNDAALADPEAFYAQLLEVILSVHAAGVAHADLKRKDNILVGPGETPYLIDFGSAIIARGGDTGEGGYLFRQACRIDLNAWVKHKYLGRYDEISDTDFAYYRPTKLERAARVVRRAWRKATFRKLRRRRRASRG